MKRKTFLVLAASAFLLVCGGAALRNRWQHDGQVYGDLPAEPDVMLVDFYRSADAEEGGYYELVLYTTEDPKLLRLTEYVKAHRGAVEQSKDHTVSAAVLEQCMAVIRKNGLERWAKLPDGVCEEGTKLVCRFRSSDGTYCRAANDCMPANGRVVLEEIGSLLQQCLP
ncbi:MAG: hypothetical protein IJ412_02910 [Oscillospiraceae bacterium]|nr:hypothetical protein [Oscillospiraceae bacterium]